MEIRITILQSFRIKYLQIRFQFDFNKNILLFLRFSNLEITVNIEICISTFIFIDIRSILR